MPMYCFSMKDDSKVEERVYPIGKAPKFIMIKGKRYYRNLLAEHGGMKTNAGCWPQHCYALGVHPSQRKEAYDESVRIGVKTNFDPEGLPIFTSQKHRKDYCHQAGYFDRNAGYGDPTPRGDGNRRTSEETEYD